MTIKVFSVAEMVAAEKAADAAGVTYAQMMERAGQRLADAIIARWSVSGRHILVLIGPGNNGGDGLVAGRYLAQAGAEVSFYLLKPRLAAEDANLAQVVAMGLPVVEAGREPKKEWLDEQVAMADIIIDAVLGTGVTRPIAGDLAVMMQRVAQRLLARQHVANDGLTTVGSLGRTSHSKPYKMVAVDCPSGLNCDTGALDPLAISADLTVTFAGPKRGHFRFPGAAACGELLVAGIDIPPDLPAVRDVPLHLATAGLARRLLPERPGDGHKGTFGTILVAAGSASYFGAPFLSGLGAYRAGAGLVALAVPRAIRATIAGRLPEATYIPLKSKSRLKPGDARLISRHRDRYGAILFGPGLGEADAFVSELLDQFGVQTSDFIRELRPHAGAPPFVVDADGLNALARLERWPARLPGPAVLTPHPGEMARLTGLPASELKGADRVALSTEYAQAWGHVVLLKGAYTIVAAPDGRCTLLPFANPVLAVGGSGDVLAGAIGALLAQGLDPYAAAVLGGFLHGAAGDLAADARGGSGLLAAELADWIPKAREALLAGA